jgi:uncharacterized Zn finger protein
MIPASRGKDAIAAGLRQRRAQGAAPAEETTYPPDAVETVAAPALADCLDRYWDLGTSAEQVTLRIAAPAVAMTLLKRLGVPDFLDTRSLPAQMKRVYDGVTARALAVAFADATE